MRPEDIRLRVEQHYASSNEPLLLSDLGKDLSRSGLWPPQGETRPLANVIADLAPDLRLVRDPDAKAYVVVVPADREELAKAAIDRRQGKHLLRSLPRPILLAFCVDSPPGAEVYLRVEPSPPRYQVGNQPDDPAFVLVETEFRSPGVYIDDPLQLKSETADQLVRGIQGWAQKHNIALDKLPVVDKGPWLGYSAVPAAGLPNALERLYAAQSREMAGRLVVPLDIAVILSRHP